MTKLALVSNAAFVVLSETEYPSDSKPPVVPFQVGTMPLVTDPSLNTIVPEFADRVIS